VLRGGEDVPTVGPRGCDVTLSPWRWRSAAVGAAGSECISTPTRTCAARTGVQGRDWTDSPESDSPACSQPASCLLNRASIAANVRFQAEPLRSTTMWGLPTEWNVGLSLTGDTERRLLELRRRHPELSVDAIRALGWNFSYSAK